MPSFGKTIQSSVGQRPAGNGRNDQNVIIDLLSNIIPDNGGPTSQLPPATGGPEADFRLVNAIFNFQRTWGSTTGVFAGASVGVSLMEVVMKSNGPPIRPDPSVFG